MLDRFERFSYAIAEINKNWHKLASEEMEKYELKSAHCVYLLTLYQNPEGLTTPQLCDICGKDKADASRMLRTMEEKALVCKTGGHQNRYGGIFQLTQQGMVAASHIRDRACQAVEYAGGDLTDAQRENFYMALEQITMRLRELGRNGIPPAE